MLFDLSDPDLDGALPLLARAATEPPLADAGLPIVVASDLAQWRFELRALGLHLERVGLRPRHVARALAPSGAGVWIVPSDCDLPELRTRALRAWQFLLRQSAEGWVGLPGEDSTAPWGVVVLADDRLAFVPRTAFTAARPWISAHVVTETTYSAALWSLPIAAIRAGIRTGGLRRDASSPRPSDPPSPTRSADPPRAPAQAGAPPSDPPADAPLGHDPLQPVFFVVTVIGVAMTPAPTAATPTPSAADTVAP